MCKRGIHDCVPTYFCNCTVKQGEQFKWTNTCLIPIVMKYAFYLLEWLVNVCVVSSNFDV